MIQHRQPCRAFVIGSDDCHGAWSVGSGNISAAAVLQCHLSRFRQSSSVSLNCLCGVSSRLQTAQAVHACQSPSILNHERAMSVQIGFMRLISSPLPCRFRCIAFDAFTNTRPYHVRSKMAIRPSVLLETWLKFGQTGPKSP